MLKRRNIKVASGCENLRASSPIAYVIHRHHLANICGMSGNSLEFMSGDRDYYSNLLIETVTKCKNFSCMH